MRKLISPKEAIKKGVPRKLVRINGGSKESI